MYNIAGTDTSETGIDCVVMGTQLSSNQEKCGKNQYMQREQNTTTIYSRRYNLIERKGLSL